MKKLIIANCILAVAVLFSFCAKPDQAEEQALVGNDEIATNRVPCTLINNTNPVNTATIRICGTNTNLQGCQSCVGGKSQGVVFSQGGQLVLPLNAPVCFSVTSDLPTWVNFSTAGGNTLPPIFIAGGQACEEFCIDANCTITNI